VKKWLIVALSLLWLGWELYAANDHDPHTWPLTEVIVRKVPAYITLPAALLLAVWLPWHFWSAYRAKKRHEQQSEVQR
jgi:hypothetical protein